MHFYYFQNTKRSSSVQLTFNILVYTKLQSRIKRIVNVSYLCLCLEIVERYSCSKYNNSITQIAKQSSFRNDVLDQTVNLLNCDFSVCSISVVQSYNLFSAFVSLSTQFLIRHKTFLVTKIRFALDSFNVLYMSRLFPETTTIQAYWLSKYLNFKILKQTKRILLVLRTLNQYF